MRSRSTKDGPVIALTTNARSAVNAVKLEYYDTGAASAQYPN